LGLLYAFLSAASYTGGNLLMKKGMWTGNNNTGYLMTVFCNVVLLGLFFVISLFVVDFHFSWMGTLIFAAAGILTTGIGRLSYFISVNKIGPSRSSAIKNSAPIFALLFAFFLLGERLSLGPTLGISIILLAFLYQGILLFKRKNGTELDSDNSYLGYVIALGAAVCFGVGQGIRKQGLLFLENAYFGAWIGALSTLIFMIIYEYYKGRLKEQFYESKKGINRNFILVGILTSFGVLFYFIGVTYTKVAYVSTIAAIEPLLTIFLSSLLFKGKEQLTITNWIVTIVIFFGILTIVWFS
jgi:drug/metabolite transporter (DMT)-like permease